MEIKDFITPLEQALEKIKITEFGIPLEHCNQISVTNGSFREIMQKSPSVLLLPYCAKRVDCDLRYAKGCKLCGQDACSIGPAWRLGRHHRMRVISITSYEDLWTELVLMRQQGVEAFIGCCCQPFYAKHADDFRRSKLPGILLDIDNTTCYDLDQAKQAYAGTFESQTSLNLDLLETVLNASAAGALVREASG
jgi:lipoate-protein ligase A